MHLDDITQRRRLPGLDGIRAVSVFAVIVSHAGLVSVGGLGVNTFFVLSGFLITWLLLVEWQNDADISMRMFYSRRVLRIFPAYYFFIAVSISADLLLGQDEIRPAILPALTYTTNYFNVFNDHPPLSVAHTWSLAIEEQFYLLWPAVMLVILRANPRWLVPVLIGIIVTCVVWRIFAFTSMQWGISYVYNAFETRADSLASGCLLAVLMLRPGFRELASRAAGVPLASLLALVLMVWLHISGEAIYRYTIGYTVSSLLAAFLITQLMLLSVQQSPWRILEYRPLCYLGVISYPMYLWHGRCLELAGKAGFGDGWAQMLAGAIICVVVASGSYFLVEQPFLRIKRRFAVV